jgi:hypothetical protein
MSAEAPSALERWLKIAGVSVTLLGLIAGAYQFTRNQAVEAARPFLERKLKWCEMVAFGNGLRSESAGANSGAAIAIAHACRNEMARDWSPMWKR